MFFISKQKPKIPRMRGKKETFSSQRITLSEFTSTIKVNRMSSKVKKDFF